MSELVGELAQRIKDLETSLLGLARQVQAMGSTRERLDDLEKTLLELAKETRKQQAAKQRERDWVPVAWTDRASQEEWRDLVAWVDWLRGTYDVIDERSIPPCWPAHRGLANELAALHRSWIAAQKSDHDEKDHQALMHWHDRWLAPAMARVRMYGTRQCGARNHEPVIMPSPTDHSLIPGVGEYVTAATR